MSTTTKTRAEIEAHEVRLGVLAHESWAARVQYGYAVQHLHSVAGDRKEYGYRDRIGHWTKSIEECVGVAERIAGRLDGTHVVHEAQKALDAYRTTKAAFSRTREAVIAHEEAYTGWSRFWLVPGGHIHKSTNCPSLRPTTSIDWFPKLSDRTEEEAVAAHGPTMCSRCFKSAPVEWQQKAKLPKSDATTTVSDFT